MRLSHKNYAVWVCLELTVTLILHNCELWKWMLPHEGESLAYPFSLQRKLSSVYTLHISELKEPSDMNV